MPGMNGMNGMQFHGMPGMHFVNIGNPMGHSVIFVNGQRIDIQQG